MADPISTKQVLLYPSYLSVSVIAVFIGRLTNHIAVKMLLRPQSRRGLWLLLLLLLPSAAAAEQRSAAKAPLRRIAFGSCLQQHLPAPVFQPILAFKPDLFIFLGDNIYADARTEKTLNDEYNVLLGREDFKRLRRETQVIATWDDHDYGEDDSGRENPLRTESKQSFLRVFGRGPSDDRLFHEGIYTVQSFGTPDKLVQVILLDTRSFRSRLPRDRSRVAIPNLDSDAAILGSEQWDWLETQLSKPAAVRFLVSSIQVLSDDLRYETWARFPLERARLFNLIQQSRAEGLLILSGDRHQAELFRSEPALNYPLHYPLYEFTASSFNQHGSNEDPGRFRIEGPVRDPNFGEIVIDWAGRDTVLELSAVDQAGQKRFFRRIQLSELAVRAPSLRPEDLSSVPNSK